MRWIEIAYVSLPLAACSSKARPMVACRRTAAFSCLSSSRTRDGDSGNIRPSTPQEGKDGSS